MSELRVHKLKTWPKYFELVKRARKTCELRKADRDYQIGDCLELVEFDPETDRHTGRRHYAEISHILTAADPPRGLIDGYVVLSLDYVGKAKEDVLNGHPSIIYTRKEVLP